MKFGNVPWNPTWPISPSNPDAPINRPKPK